MTSRQATIGFVAATFALLSAVSSLQIYIARVAAHEPGSPALTSLMGSATWVVWALFAPGILWLGRRFDFRPGRRALSIGVHLAGLLVCHLPSAFLVTWLGFKLFSPNEPPSAELFRQALFTSSRLQLSLILYAAILGLGYAVRLWHTLRERDLQASRLQAQAAQARLEALATRLHPHFLFNTLHAVGALIAEDPVLARTMLVQLGDLLRDLLADPTEIEVTLRDELALLRRYLDIEQIRFADRLRIEVAAPEDTLRLLVPRLLLQPLVENALRHGLAPKGSGGLLRFEASRSNGTLTLRVWNDGIPLAEGYRSGIGLSTTKERLLTRHGAQATLALRSAGGGVETVVELPAVSSGS